MSFWLIDLLAGGAWWVERLADVALCSCALGFFPAGSSLPPSGPSQCRPARSLHLAVVLHVAQHLLPLPDHVEVQLGEHWGRGESK